MTKVIGDDGRRVGIFWNYHSCPSPSALKGRDVARRLQNSASSFGGPIATFRVYTSSSPGVEPEGELTVRAELKQSGASMINIPPLGANDILDKIILVDILAFARTQPAPAVVFVISSAQGYASVFLLLRGRQHLVALLPPSLASSLALRAQTDFLLDWTNVFGAHSTPRESAFAKASQKPSRCVRRIQETSMGGGSLGWANGTATGNGQSEHNGLRGRVAKFTNNTPTQPSSTSGSSQATQPIPSPPMNGRQLTNTRHGDTSPPPIPLGETSAPNLTRALMLSDIPAYFHDLICIVHGCRGVLASKVFQRLLERNPRLYEQAGLGSFQDYIHAAVQVGIVSCRTGIKKGKPREYIDIRKGYMDEWMEKSRYAAKDGS